ncbi:hypothetical protein DEDE109153_14265 [Deinococcus deserti]|uniref:hypothetical protein n=1 Tax=Deinococcus deserti TaxID=310783 RepID=UPI00059C8B14|nr:hypothetical protein [Deinococcus deserti]
MLTGLGHQTLSNCKSDVHSLASNDVLMRRGIDGSTELPSGIMEVTDPDATKEKVLFISGADVRIRDS